MKVYHIISESRLTPFLDILEKIGLPEIDKALGYLARLVKGSKFTAAEIAESWAAAAKKTGLPFEEIVAMGERELRTAGVDEGLIKKALQKADEIEPGVMAKVTARVEADMSAATWLGKSLATVNSYATALGLGVPIALCIKNIGLEYADYQKSPKTQADYETFQHSSQYWINKCVGEVAAVIIGNWFIAKVVSIPGGWVGMTGSKKLSGFYAGLNNAAQAAFTAAITSPQGRQYLAELFVADLIMDVPVAVGGRIEQQPIQKVIRDTVGGWTTRALGWVADQAQKITDPAGAAKKAADAKAKDAAAQAASDAQYQGVSKGRQYDAYGMPIRQADPRGQITPLN